MNRRQIVSTLAALVIGFGAGAGTVSVTNRPTSPKPRATLVQPPASTPGFPRETSVRPEGYAPAKPPASVHLGGSAPSIRVSNSGLNLIEGFEGFSSCPYWDPFGHVWTRGFGETDFGGNFGGRCITRTQGQNNLRNKVESEYQWAVRALGVNFNQNQVDALDSFVWNLGAGIFQGTLRFDLQHRLFFSASRIMLEYDHAGGQVLEGLRIRREKEVTLFLKPVPHHETPQQRQARERHELREEKRHRQEIRILLTQHRCRIVHGPQAYRACPAWGHEGRVDNKRIRALEAALG